MADWPDRLNRFIDALQADRRPERGQASTPEELEELRMAGAIMGSRSERAEPDLEFLDSLRTRLHLAVRPGSRLSRAGLLRAAGFWAAGLASGLGVAWGIRTRQAVPIVPIPATEAALPAGKWFAAGLLADIGPKEVVSFDAGAVPTFLIRDGNSVKALSRVCTHMACLLHYQSEDTEFECPCHGATFDLNGRINTMYGMSLPPLPPVDVRIVNGIVYVLGA
jgi:nitrite reductase/ring-hydroxylating ferredoxin subunit